MIQKHYRYCPFCGDRQDRSAEPMVTAYVRSLKQADPAARAKDYLARLCLLEKRLARLDQELDELVPSSSPVDPAGVSREITP